MEGMNDEDITQELEIERYSNQVMRIPRYIGNFLVTKNLMETNSCVVVLASDPEVDEKIAIKCIPISETAIIAWDHEVQVMNSLDHPNIIKCLNYFQFPSDEPRFCTIVMPLAIYDLYTYVEKKMPLSEIKICRIFYDVINAVISMHRRSCWHRDIKLENILIIDETTPLPYAVVSDFGLSAYMPGEAVRGIGTGTLEYAAPELVETVYSESEHAFVRQFKQEAECMLYSMNDSMTFTKKKKKHHELFQNKTEQKLNIYSNVYF